MGAERLLLTPPEYHHRGSADGGGRPTRGKCQSIASLLYMRRSFVHMVYFAIYATGRDALPNCRWLR